MFRAKRLIEQGKVHLYCEVSVIAVAPLRSSNYYAIPLIALPSCKRAPTDSQMQTILAVLDEWNTNPISKSLGLVASVASDGDSTRRSALENLLASGSILSDGLSQILASLPLLDSAVGPYDATTHYDDKHLVK